jgi:protein TonB
MIFLAIPLSQLLEKIARPEDAAMQSVVMAPPPPPQPPPPPPPEQEEPEPEEPPPEMEPEPMDLDIPMPDLPSGFGAGSFFIDEKYNIDLTKDALGSDGIFSADQLDDRPSLLRASPPRYPSAMKRAKKEGRVLLYMVIDEGGRVFTAEVRKSTDPGFNAEALKAARKWKFKPGTKNGQPVRAKILQPISFKLGS